MKEEKCLCKHNVLKSRGIGGFLPTFCCVQKKKKKRSNLWNNLICDKFALDFMQAFQIPSLEVL